MQVPRSGIVNPGPKNIDYHICNAFSLFQKLCFENPDAPSEKWNLVQTVIFFAFYDEKASLCFVAAGIVQEQSHRGLATSIRHASQPSCKIFFKNKAKYQNNHIKMTSEIIEMSSFLFCTMQVKGSLYAVDSEYPKEK